MPTTNEHFAVSNEPTLVLTRSDVQALLGIDQCIEAVGEAFAAYAMGTIGPPGVLESRAVDGGFHVKTALLTRGRPYFAAKINANFPLNRERSGRPTIQGVLALFDAEVGRPLALMDSLAVTILRTAAATAVAARYLARADARVVTMCGCGDQARSQLLALSRVRTLDRIFVHDMDGVRAEALAGDLAEELGLEVTVAPRLTDATRASDVCITCTPARRFVLAREDVSPGTFIAAVGADNPAKQEIEPQLMARSTVVVDVLEQCAEMGDLHHALAAGVMRRTDVHAELGEIIVGRKPGRTTAAEITLFDSTGTGIQDVAAAAIVYENARAEGRGARIPLSR